MFCLFKHYFNFAINGISSDLQVLLRYFNDTAIVTFLRISLLLSSAGWASVSSTNLLLYMKDLKATSFAILAINLAASSLEWNYKLLFGK